MTSYRPRTAKCAVCEAQTNYHANWYLVIENRWLDSLKVLSWHPALADQRGMKCVCSDEHLKVLVEHWLTEANLELRGEEKSDSPPLLDFVQSVDQSRVTMGKVLGELAVDRYPLTHVWTGSAQMLECILHAITGRDSESRVAARSFAYFQASPPPNLARAHSAGWA